MSGAVAAAAGHKGVHLARRCGGPAALPRSCGVEHEARCERSALGPLEHRPAWQRQSAVAPVVVACGADNFQPDASQEVQRPRARLAA